MKKRFFIGVVESIFYCLGVYLLFFYYSNFKNDFLTMNMQPFTIVIGIMALKYGLYISLQTVMVASLFYIFSYYQLGNDPVVFFLDFSYYKFILIFFFIALSLGRFSDNNKKKIADLNEKNKNLENKIQNQRDKNLELVNINERLKTRIVGSKESILTLHKITSSILVENVEKIITQILEILIDFLGSDVVSLYIYNKEKNTLRARVKVGESIISNFIEVKDGDVYSKVLKSNSVESGKRELKEPLYVAPILKGEKVIGFINIERIKYGNQEKYLLELFKVISQWVNNALLNAFEKSQLDIIKNSYENTRIYNLEYFSYIFEEDKKRKKLFGTEYIALEGKNPGLTAKELNDRIKGKVREIDIVGMDSHIIKFLFVNASKESKEILKTRVHEILPGVELYEI